MARHRTPRSILATLFALATLAATIGPATAASPAPAVPPDRLARLATGVNITRWFWNPEDIQRHADHATTSQAWP